MGPTCYAQQDQAELVRPLSKAARDVLDTLPRKSDYVFAGRNGAINSRSKSKERLDRDSGVPDGGSMTCDVRRGPYVPRWRAEQHAELCLGHVLPGIRATYDRHRYRREAAAFEALAKLVRQIVNSTGAAKAT